jgi:hypothetical protein
MKQSERKNKEREELSFGSILLTLNMIPFDLCSSLAYLASLS